MRGSAAATSMVVRTGSESGDLVKLGLGLVAAGGLAVVTIRKRRQDAVSVSVL